MCSHVNDINARNKCITTKHLSYRVIGIISLERRFQSSIIDIRNWFQNKCLTTKHLSNRVIGIISLERRFQSSIIDIRNWFQNSMAD